MPLNAIATDDHAIAQKKTTKDGTLWTILLSGPIALVCGSFTERRGLVVEEAAEPVPAAGPVFADGDPGEIPLEGPGEIPPEGPGEIPGESPGEEPGGDFPGEEVSITRITELVKEADAIILATPEYHGSYSSVIKLIIDNLGYPSALCGKAIGILGVAASPFGALKAIEHLNSITTHLGCHTLPKVVNVASCYQIFDPTGALTDEKVKERLETLATDLVEYAKKF